MATVLVRGTGSIGSRHLRVLSGLGVSEVLAWPVRPGRVAGPELGRARVVDGLVPGCDLVVVATDTARHVDDALEALDADAAVVLLEKPVAPTAADAERLLAHPRADRVRVCAPLRFHEGLGRARAAVRDLGGPLAARVVCQSWLPAWRPTRDYRESYSARPAEGGVLRDLVHELDYAAWILGAPVGVDARLAGGPDAPSPVLGIPVDEAADLLWRTAAGHTVSVRLDYVTRPSRRGFTVTGPEGALEWDALAATLTLTDRDGAARQEQHPADLEVDTVLARQAAEALALADGGAAPVLATLAEGIAAVRVADAARAADARHREVS